MELPPRQFRIIGAGGVRRRLRKHDGKCAVYELLGFLQETKLERHETCLIGQPVNVQRSTLH